MFTKKVTDDDSFMELSSSAQALYLHLSMSADDDGFCNQVNICMFKAHASIQDLQMLLEKRYIYQFDNGVIVIKHWRMANALRKDRYTHTVFQKELAQLEINENGSYKLSAKSTDDIVSNEDGCRLVATCLPQVSIGKNSINNNICGTNDNKRFVKPSIEEIQNYINEKKYSIDANKFYDYYESNGWRVGKNPMKDWKAAVRTWNSNTNNYSSNTTNNSNSNTSNTNKSSNFQKIRASDYE